MAKGKRSNSPKRSRRGGRRSPKKSKNGVMKKINKGEAEPARKLDLNEVEDPDCECELQDETEGLQELPKMPDEVPVADFSTIKEEVVQFFWESLEDAHVSLKSVSQLPENLFFFGTVAAEIAKTGKFTDELESKLAAVGKADEAWLRALLAGEVEPAKPEEPEAPEEPVEQSENVEAAVAEEVEIAEEPTMEAEVAAEVVAEVAAEAPEIDDVAMEGAVEEPAFQAEEPAVPPMSAEGYYVPEAVVSEPAFNKENTADVIAEAVKTVSSKLGEQAADPVAPVEGLAPKDLNVTQPFGLA
jgi:hypothetical protein